MAIPAPKLVAVVVKEVPSPGDAVNGLAVPGETSIGYCNLTFGIFKDKKVARHLPGEDQRTRANIRIIFVFGKHQCVGRNVALMELNKVFVEVSVYGIFHGYGC